MATATRPRISAEFLRANTCERIIAGTSKVIAERGYQAATVADIVKACGTARNTFYDCFGGKEEAALAMVAALDLEIEELSEAPSIDTLLIEVAAMHHAGEPERASEFLLFAEKVIRFFGDASLAPPPPSDDPREGTLPPGRHGLPREFIVANQQARLLSGLAHAVVERGWPATRISDVSARASTSRRTFYEHYGDLDALARGMVATSLPTDLLDGLDPRSGLFAVAIEILAERECDGDPSATAGKALGAVYALVAAFEASA